MQIATTFAAIGVSWSASIDIFHLLEVIDQVDNIIASGAYLVINLSIILNWWPF